MPHTRVKICGITRPEDAIQAAELGADFIGVNTFNGPREITPAVAKAIASELPQEVPVVALTEAFGVKGGVISWSRELFESGIRLLQIYFVDTLPVDFTPTHNFGSWHVRHIKHRDDLRGLNVAATRLPSLPPAAILLDTASTSQLGGTGQTFNWPWIAQAREAGELTGLPPIILAGGLTPDNVAGAIQIAQPYAVDVSSGVEVRGKPGIKDPIKLRDFIQAVRGS